MKEEHAQPLIAYGRWLMAHVAGQSPGNAPDWVAEFARVLGWTHDATRDAPLQSILTLIELDGLSSPPAYIRPTPLGLSDDAGGWAHFPVPLVEARDDRADLHRSFLAAGGAQEASFDRFFHLMRKFGSTLPNTYGEPGVSLFEQWKIVAALVAIADSTAKLPTSLGLVKGDIPGIQRTINTITSKGAARGMRGRSAFIQLLGGALVRKLLEELKLSPANVVYDAGGNFVLLVPWVEGAGGTYETVRNVSNGVNKVLLFGAGDDGADFDGFHGDLSVAIAAMPLADGLAAIRWGTAPATRPSPWQQAEGELQEAMTAEKNRPFGGLVGEPADFAKLFAPEPADTDDDCAICRRLRQENEPQFARLDRDDADSPRACPACIGFNELANDMGHGDRLLVLTKEPPDRGPAAGWQAALHAVSGLWYALEPRPYHPPLTGARDTLVLALNPDTFDPSVHHGFRWLARTTPTLTTDEDVTIKANDVIAGKSKGIQRLGVLRMDVDNLGDLIVRGLPARTPMQTAELSQTLERFFAGWLDRICKRVDEGEKLFYVLFAGGDDLFVIGPWHLMPTLATAIRNDFRRYCNGHPAIHLSGGIAVVGDHAPMHQAAEASHEALSEAKKLDRDDPAAAKNAVTFLGHTLHWDAFSEVETLKDHIVVLAESDALGSAVITRLLAIDRRYRRDCGREPYGQRGQTPARMAEPVYYGPWMWQQVYAFARLKEGRDDDVKARLTRLEEKLVKEKKIPQLGLAARWAQWLVRS